MGKVRRYKKKLSKAAAVTETNGGGGEPEERPQPVDYMALAEELMELKKNDDKMSVCSVMKSVKSGGDESLKLKKDAKRFLKRAFLLKSTYAVYDFVVFSFFYLARINLTIVVF